MHPVRAPVVVLMLGILLSQLGCSEGEPSGVGPLSPPDAAASTVPGTGPGPAPGPADSSGGASAGPVPLVPTALQVEASLARGRFAEPRTLSLPRGFQVNLYAAGVAGARFMAVGPGGDLYLSLSRRGEVVALPDRDNDGVADRVVTIIQGLDRPHGLAWHEGQLYVAEHGRVLRLRYRDGEEAATGYDVVVDDLPRGGGHWTRSIAFGPDGGLYVSAGSSCNVCREEDPHRAAITRYHSDGSGKELYAQGLRNSVGLAFHPETGELWATENGRDHLGDDWPPEEINIIRRGNHYGWPFCHGSQVPDPQFGQDYDCGQTRPPAVMMQAHSAPLGLAFYTGDAFPDRYQGQLFVAFHGSWNRSEPTGYKVVWVPVQDGRPLGEYADFLTGFLADGRAWGRPVDLVVGEDGALYLSDDYAGAVYRITFMGS